MLSLFGLLLTAATMKIFLKFIYIYIYIFICYIFFIFTCLWLVLTRIRRMACTISARVFGRETSSQPTNCNNTESRIKGVIMNYLWATKEQNSAVQTHIHKLWRVWKYTRDIKEKVTRISGALVSWKREKEESKQCKLDLLPSSVSEAP